MSVEMPDELNEVLEFLYGAEALDGVWYGETPTDRPRYWWRSKLRSAVKAYGELCRRAALEEAAQFADNFPTLYGFHSCFAVAGEIRKQLLSTEEE